MQTTGKSDILEKAAALGSAGYAKGFKAPAQDPGVMPLIREASKASEGTKAVIKVLDAWNNAWHHEHLVSIGLA